MIANAGEDIENLALFRLGILRTLGGQQRQLQAARQFDRRLVAGFLCAVVVALQFDINIVVAIDRDKLFERAPASSMPPCARAYARGPSSPPVMQISPEAYSARSSTEAMA